MTVALVHGFPETPAVWRPLQARLDGDAVAVSLPGLGSARPAGFTATKDAYADALAAALAELDGPLDVVGHDIGALLTLRITSAFDLPLRSWAVDVANVFHRDWVWPERSTSCRRPTRRARRRVSSPAACPNSSPARWRPRTTRR